MYLNIVRGSCIFFAYSLLLREMQLAFDVDDFKQSIAKIMERGESEKSGGKKKKDWEILNASAQQKSFLTGVTSDTTWQKETLCGERNMIAVNNTPVYTHWVDVCG